MSEPNPEEAKRVVKFLNELLATDGEAIRALFKYCVPCNERLDAHPTVQTRGEPGTQPFVGFLGILNGLLGAYSTGVKRGHGPISAVFDDRTDELLFFDYNANIQRK